MVHCLGFKITVNIDVQDQTCMIDGLCMFLKKKMVFVSSLIFMNNNRSTNMQVKHPFQIK